MEDLLQKILVKLEGLGQKIDLLETGQTNLARRLDAIFSQVAELTESRHADSIEVSVLCSEVAHLSTVHKEQAAVLEKLSFRSMKQEAELNALRQSAEA